MVLCVYGLLLLLLCVRILKPARNFGQLDSLYTHAQEEYSVTVWQTALASHLFWAPIYIHYEITAAAVHSHIARPALSVRPPARWFIFSWCTECMQRPSYLRVMFVSPPLLLLLSSCASCVHNNGSSSMDRPWYSIHCCTL